MTVRVCVCVCAHLVFVSLPHWPRAVHTSVCTDQAHSCGYPTAMLVAQAALPSSESCALAIVPRSSQIVEKAPASSDAELIVTPAKTRVRRTKSDLPSAEKSVTDQIVQCQSCEPTTVLASYAEHRQLCRFSPKECAYCYWANSGASIQEQIKQNTGAASL